MRFVIAGAGALGTVYAVLLTQAGADVCVLTRPSRVEALRGGMRVRGLREETAKIRVVTSAAEIGTAEYLILTTKVGDSAAIGETLRGADIETALSLQNGLAKNDTLDDIFGPERVIGAACAVVAGQGMVYGEAVLTMNRATWIGERAGAWPRSSARTARLAALFRSAGLPSWTVADATAVEWYKLCALLPGSLVTALARCTYSEMALHPYLAQQFVVLMREVFAIPQALGVFGDDTKVIDPPGAPWSFGTWLSTPDEVALAGLRTIGEAQVATGQKVFPSMVQDVLAGRRTEVETLVGGLIDRARTCGVPLPATETCYRLLRGLESTFARA